MAITVDQAEEIRILSDGAYDLDAAHYHADPVPGGSLSSTVARRIVAPSCPALARHAMDQVEYKDAYDLGTVVHRLILGAGPPIVEVPASSWRTAAAKDAREQARAGGSVALLSEDLEEARRMADAVHACPEAHALLTLPGAPEKTLVWQEAGIWGRAMLDYWPYPDPDSVRVIVDVKTTSSGLDDDSLSKTIWSYGYHQQEDWYRRGYEKVHGLDADFYFVFVSSAPPHLVRVVPLCEDLRADAHARNDEAIVVWRECLETGEWPAYENTLNPIAAPRWANLRKDYA